MKTYTKKTTRLKALPRSKRARYGSTGASSSTMISPAAGAIQGDVSGHTHSNLPELEKFSTDSDGYGYLNRVVENSDGSVTRQTDKMKSGYADDSGNWDGHAFDDYIDQPVRKADIPEFAGLIAGLLKSRGFTSGALGSGFMLGSDGDGNAVLEVDKVIVRKAMEVAELIIQQLSHQGGISIYTPASIECTSVVATSSGYKCSFDNHSNTVPNLFKQGDQARCQRFDLGSTSAKYYWRLVTEVGSDYIVLSKSDCDSGSGIPEAGDRIIQMGNRTDAARQKAAVMDVIGTDAPRLEFYDGIDSYDLSGKLITVIGVVDGKVGVYTDAGRFNNIAIGEGSSGLENLAEWAGKQNKTDAAKAEAKSAGQKPENAQNTADSAADAAEQAKTDANSAKAAAEKAQADADAARLAADNAQVAADNAALTAASAQSDANSARSRLDNMASDSIISAVEKPALVQQSADIVSEYNQIVADCAKYSVTYTAFTSAFDAAITALDKYTEDLTSDTAKESDYDDIAAYYAARQTVLDAIASAAKQLADDAKVKADAAASEAAKALASAETAQKSVGELNDDQYFSIPEKRIIRNTMQAITQQKETALIYSGTIARSMVNGDAWVKVTQEDADANADLAPYVGFYRSQNHDDSSYSTVKLTFNLETDGIATVQVVSDGESAFDYLVLSKIDPAKDLTDGTLYDSSVVDLSTMGKRGTVFTKSYGLTAGTHTLQIMFRKDSSTSNYTDSGYYRITTEGTEGYNEGLSGSFHDTYNAITDEMDPDSSIRDDFYDSYFVPLVEYLAGDTCYLWEDTVTEFADGSFRDTISALLRNYYRKEAELRSLITEAVMSDYEYLKETFSDGKSYVGKGVVMSELVAVINSDDEVEGILNGSSKYQDTTHGKRIIAAGIPSVSEEGSNNLDDRIVDAETTIFEDGTLMTKKLEAKAGSFKGNLEAVSGSFKTLKCVDAAGNVVGRIGFNADGSIRFDHDTGGTLGIYTMDIFHNGTKNGRSLRFYASDMWVRGAFSARTRMAVVVESGNVAKYYYQGLNKAVFSTSYLTSATDANGLVYYKLPLIYDNSNGADEAIGMSAEIVIIKQSGTTTRRYNVITGLEESMPGKKFTFINANDDNNNIYLYAHSKTYQVQGGHACEVIDIGSDNMLPAISTSLPGESLLILSDFDNNW